MPRAERHYYYRIDRRGDLWHDHTHLTDPTFLHTFFRRLRRDPHPADPDYPFVSPCAGEHNHVHAEVTPIVFRRLAAATLLANGGITVPFDPTTLRVDRDGRLFHRAPVAEFGLLLPAALADLAPQLDHRGGGYVFRCGDRTLPIAALG